MLKILIQTQVHSSIEIAWSKFDQALFEKLKPPFLPMKLLRFDGCRVGDQVHLDLGLSQWISLITESVDEGNKKWFVDEGIKLPWPLKKWRHRHLLVAQNDITLIVDDIEFEASSQLMTYLVFPALYLMFLIRKPIYKNYLQRTP